MYFVLPQGLVCGAFFVYQRDRFLNSYHFGIYIWLFGKNNGVYGVKYLLAYCVHVPVDLSVLFTCMIVVFAVGSAARACQNVKIDSLSFHLELSCFRKNFPLWPYFSIYFVCVYKIPNVIAEILSLKVVLNTINYNKN